MRKITAFLAVALLSLALASPAFGESATQDAYGGIAGSQEFTGGSGSNAALASDTTSESGTLPFTGLDVGLIALVGVGLVGTGLVIRRTNRHAPRA
jgi:hypothetical protein